MRPLEPAFFDRQMAFNLLAQVGTPDAQGHTLLEKRLVRELRQVRGFAFIKDFRRLRSRPGVLAIAFAWPCSQQALSAWQKSTLHSKMRQDIELVEADAGYPGTVGDAVGRGVCLCAVACAVVSTTPAEINLWLTSDNVRKGGGP